MHGKPGQDYLADFATIGAEPGCSPCELEAAWRRRVSDLHPDRQRPADGDRPQTLSEINGAYRRLRRFQRRHGRMPGTEPVAHPRREPPMAFAPRTRPSRGASRTWLLALFNIALLCLLATLVWMLLERIGIRDHDAPMRRASAVAMQDIGDAHHRAPFRNSTTSTVCSSTSRSKTRLWLRT